MARSCAVAFFVYDADRLYKPDALITAKAFPIESILALAGKASAKKALLDMIGRTQNATARWVGVGFQRIATQALQSACIERPGVAYDTSQRKIDSNCESALLDMSRLSIAQMGQGIFLHGQCAIDKNAASQFLEIMPLIFGTESIDLASTIGSSREPARCIQACLDWTDTRILRLELEKQIPKADGPPTRRPSI